MLLLVVILPAVDFSVFVLVDLDPDDVGAVHVAPGIDPAISVGVELEQLQPAGLVVVDRRDLRLLAFTGVATADAAYGGCQNHGNAQSRAFWACARNEPRSLADQRKHSDHDLGCRRIRGSE